MIPRVKEIFAKSRRDATTPALRSAAAHSREEEERSAADVWAPLSAAAKTHRRKFKRRSIVRLEMGGRDYYGR